MALDCVILMDRTGRIVQFNRAAERTFGYSAAEVVGRELAGLIIPTGKRGSYRAALGRYLAMGDTSILNRHLELIADAPRRRRVPARSRHRTHPLGWVRRCLRPTCATSPSANGRSASSRTTRVSSGTRATQSEQNAQELAALVDQLRVTQG